MRKSITACVLALILALPVLAGQTIEPWQYPDGTPASLELRPDNFEHVYSRGCGNPVDSLSGNFDVGGGNNDYPDLVTVANALDSAGVNGPCVFNVYPGTYDGCVYLRSIEGASATNTMTFIGLESASGQRPIISNTVGSGSGDGCGIFFEGAPYITFDNFELCNVNAYGIRLGYTAVDTSTNCTIKNFYIHDVGIMGGEHGIWSFRCRNFSLLNTEIDGGAYAIFANYCPNSKFINNMMMNSTYITSTFGLYADDNSEIYYNSVYCPLSERAFYAGSMPGCDIRNNIFFNDRVDGFAIYLSSTMPAICDYNCFYSPNGFFGYLGLPINTLADWRTTTGFDMNSIYGDPLFVGETDVIDLHIRSYMQSPVSGAATPIATVTDDIDGDLRSVTAPDMGADEYDYSIPNYGVTVVPHHQMWQAGAAGDILHYYFNITNTGSLSDTYNLSITGASWPTAIYDSSGANIITSTNNLASLANQWVMVAHTIPAGTPGGMTDTGNLVVTSQTMATVTDNGEFCTHSASLMGSFDVGGGNNDYPTIIDGVNGLYAFGMAGPCTLNVYTGTYPGMVKVDHNLAGLGESNPLIIQAASGESPRITNTLAPGDLGSGIWIYRADYVTVKGFEIDSCNGMGFYACNLGTDSTVGVKFMNNYVHNIGLDGYGYGVNFEAAVDCYIIGNEIEGGYMGLVIYSRTTSTTYNNMIYNQDSHGVWISDGVHNFCYNTIIINPVGSYSYAIYASAMGASTIYNNIIANLGASTSVVGYGLSGLTGDSDYNCIYVPNGRFGRFGVYITSLAGWQAATGRDFNSIDVNPYVVSTQVPFNVHLTDSSACIGAGTPVAGITVDIDGDPRDPVTPCIGADEFVVTGLQVTLTPWRPPIQVNPGGFFWYRGEVDNTTANPITFDLWSEAILPNGVHYGPLLLYNNLTLGSMGHRERAVRVNVPQFAPPGSYQYYAAVGDYPGTVIDDDQFPFTILVGDPVSSNNQWLVEPFEGGLAPIPTEFSLGSASPNPFNPATTISFGLPEDARIKLVVYDVNGREAATLVDGLLPAGMHEVEFNASGLASGIYFYRLSAPGFTMVKKMVLVK